MQVGVGLFLSPCFAALMQAVVFMAVAGVGLFWYWRKAPTLLAASGITSLAIVAFGTANAYLEGADVGDGTVAP
ncbi:hypothetical protein T484DRAFT_1780658 [Baffinella frigidus]|nr:hypothetical protein T484DRAFT_1780658 [Cryptophyta sp. CCMP2293]